ncbi:MULTISPECIES: hypothetical protein [Protofrankia]|uniref:Uncharacterized protein n=1 Tax=Protofrankia coriariae TaxID=1562887 RepID=A0ABR5F487_9ACTN|nr:MULTISPECIES: hypothetical protein [Protofrankia]KLL11448.1 hypothetical protein FrCorBMG51_10090 [Protofrankia coriariae]
MTHRPRARIAQRARLVLLPRRSALEDWLLVTEQRMILHRRALRTPTNTNLAELLDAAQRESQLAVATATRLTNRSDVPSDIPRTPTAEATTDTPRRPERPQRQRTVRPPRKRDGITVTR